MGFEYWGVVASGERGGRTRDTPRRRRDGHIQLYDLVHVQGANVRRSTIGIIVTRGTATRDCGDVLVITGADVVITVTRCVVIAIAGAHVAQLDPRDDDAAPLPLRLPPPRRAADRARRDGNRHLQFLAADGVRCNSM